MKNKKPNAALVWKQMEDLLAPQMNFSLADRAVYSHLFRHSRLVGKPQIRFSISWLARGLGISTRTARDGVRRLVSRGVLRLVERGSCTGHVVQLRLPAEIRSLRAAKTAVQDSAATPCALAGIEETDFMRTRVLRRAIHQREGGHCFYCLRDLPRRSRCIDHVVPRARMGRNTYRNLVSCCTDCNTQKGERSAEEFLRSLYRERRLSAVELAKQLRALDALAAGKLQPPLPSV